LQDEEAMLESDDDAVDDEKQLEVLSHSFFNDFSN
jgi:hypothetical protein